MTIRIVEFKTKYHGIGREPVDMVLLAPSGEAHSKTQTWHRVDKLRPPEEIDDSRRNADTYVAMNARWSVIGPAYDAWKDGTEIPETGTPLAAWSGVSPEIAEVLKGMSIRTVEDVRDMSESTFTKLPVPNARKLPQLAKEYLEGSDAAAKDLVIAEMSERMAAMEAMLESQTAPKQSKAKSEQKDTEKAA